MNLAKLEAEFKWGLLIVTDKGSLARLPDWPAGEAQVTTSGSSLGIRVLHEQEGRVTVNVWSSLSDVTGYKVFEGDLRVESGVLVVRDVEGSNFIEVVVPVGVHPVEVHLAELSESRRVELFVGCVF